MKVQLEVTRPRWFTLGTRYRKLKAAGVALGAALVVAVPVAWANHDFSDVATGDQFHSQISAIKGAGITTGCGVGLYCPTDFVRRDAMAAFMHRGFGRVAQTDVINDGTIETSPSETTDTVVSEVTITVPGAGTATQFVKVEANMEASLSTGAAPTFLRFYIADTACDSGARSPYFSQTIRDTSGDIHSLSWVRAAPPGSRAFRFCAWTDSGVLSVNGVLLIATTYPFGSTGFSTLATQTALDERPTG